MFTKKSSALLLFLVLALLPFKMASADTSISASSITNPVWTADNSPFGL